MKKPSSDIESSFNYFVKQHLHSFPKIILDESKDQEIRLFVKKAVERKKLEGGQYIKDPRSLVKRYYTGWGGECAVEKHIGKKFVDFSVGNSKDYYVPDLRSAGYEVGVKTVSMGDFPLLRKPSPSSSNTPQIIVIKESRYVFYVCGLATYDMVNHPSNFSSLLVRSSGVLELGVKSAFYRFDLLNRVQSKRSKIEI